MILGRADRRLRSVLDKLWGRGARGDGSDTHQELSSTTDVPLSGGPGGGRRWSLSQVLANREQYHVLVTLVLVGLFYARLYWHW